MILKDIYSKIPKSLDDKITSIGFDGSENDFKIDLEYDDADAYTYKMITVTLFFDDDNTLDDYCVEIKNYIKETNEKTNDYLDKKDFKIINSLINSFERK